jgi:hypothetical protein
MVSGKLISSSVLGFYRFEDGISKFSLLEQVKRQYSNSFL